MGGWGWVLIPLGGCALVAWTIWVGGQAAAAFDVPLDFDDSEEEDEG